MKKEELYDAFFGLYEQLCDDAGHDWGRLHKQRPTVRKHLHAGPYGGQPSPQAPFVGYQIDWENGTSLRSLFVAYVPGKAPKVAARLLASRVQRSLSEMQEAYGGELAIHEDATGAFVGDAVPALVTDQAEWPSLAAGLVGRQARLRSVLGGSKLDTDLMNFRV